MKTIVNGVVITEEMAEVLKKWYNPSLSETEPSLYVRGLGNIQDYLIRVWIDIDSDEVATLEFKECMSWLLMIKDDLQKFIIKNEKKGVHYE
jgi:hypothetical protein